MFKTLPYIFVKKVASSSLDILSFSWCVLTNSSGGVPTSIKLNKRKSFYLDDKRVTKNTLEKKLLNLLVQSDSRVIILRAEKNVPIDDVVYVMNIANQNSIKVVLAVDAQ